MNEQPTKNKIAEIKSLWEEYFSANDAVTNTPCIVNGTITPDWLRAEDKRVNIIDNLSDRAYSDTPQLLQYIDTLEADNAKMRAVLSALLEPANSGQSGGYIGAYPNSPARRYCMYCGEGWDHDSYEWHTGDCPIARARALLSE